MGLLLIAPIQLRCVKRWSIQAHSRWRSAPHHLMLTFFQLESTPQSRWLQSMFFAGQVSIIWRSVKTDCWIPPAFWLVVFWKDLLFAFKNFPTDTEAAGLGHSGESRFRMCLWMICFYCEFCLLAFCSFRLSFEGCDFFSEKVQPALYRAWFNVRACRALYFLSRYYSEL